MPVRPRILASLLLLAFALATVILSRSSPGVAVIVYAVAVTQQPRSTPCVAFHHYRRPRNPAPIRRLRDSSPPSCLSDPGCARSTATAISFSMPRRRSGATAAGADVPSSVRAAA